MGAGGAKLGSDSGTGRWGVSQSIGDTRPGESMRPNPKANLELLIGEGEFGTELEANLGLGSDLRMEGSLSGDLGREK